jgi:hypothetical protein
LIFSKRIGRAEKSSFHLICAHFSWAINISPFLLEIVQTYLSAHVETFTGDVSVIRLVLLSIKILPLEIVLSLFFPFFLCSQKKYKGSFSLFSPFFVMWLLIPTVLTQGFLFGLYFAYHRFLYFILLSVMMLIALGIDYTSRFFSRIIDTYLFITKESLQLKIAAIKIYYV